MRFIQDICAIFGLVVAYVIATQLTADDAATGDTKKAQCVADIDKTLDAPGGIDRPAWLPKSALDIVIGLAITVSKAYLKKTGFFGDSQPASTPSGSPSPEPALPQPAQ